VAYGCPLDWSIGDHYLAMFCSEWAEILSVNIGFHVPFMTFVRMDACAAAGGSFAVLKWLKQSRLIEVYEFYTPAAAARGGHIEVLAWLVEQGYLLKAQGPYLQHASCAQAAAGG